METLPKPRTLLTKSRETSRDQVEVKSVLEPILNDQNNSMVFSMETKFSFFLYDLFHKYLSSSSLSWRRKNLDRYDSGPYLLQNNNNNNNNKT